MTDSELEKYNKLKSEIFKLISVHCVVPDKMAFGYALNIIDDVVHMIKNGLTAEHIEYTETIRPNLNKEN